MCGFDFGGLQLCLYRILGQDGIFFDDGPRMVQADPYNNTFVVPPGGRADIEIICFYSGLYSVLATNDTKNSSFQNAPVALQKTIIMKLNVIGDPKYCNYRYFPDCNAWSRDELGKYNQLPCSPQPYNTSNYLKDTINMLFPQVTGQCSFFCSFFFLMLFI